MVFYFLLAGLVLLLTIHIYSKEAENEKYFKDKGVSFLKPKSMIKAIAELIFRKKTIFETIKETYDSFPEAVAIGMFDMGSPVLLLRDLKLIKRFAIKEFDHFVDRRNLINDQSDSLFGNALVALSGQKWRDMRSTLSPVFTGSKMRTMFPLILDVSNQMIEKINASEIDNQGMTKFEVKDLCQKFANDVIAICAFGYKLNSFEDDQNEFNEVTKRLFDFGNSFRLLKFYVIRFFPQVMKLLKIKMADDGSEFLKDLIISSMNFREEKNIFRPDMISMLMTYRKNQNGGSTSKVSNSKRMWNDTEIAAQCVLFFMAGYHTTSSVMSKAVLELALSTEIQEKLFNEIKMVNENLEDGLMTFEVLQSMEYLDMVIMETLRKHPPFPLTDRICVKDLDLDDGNGFSFKFNKGLGIWIPISAIHHDEKYFPTPDKFDPERFNNENKHKHQDAFIPFGMGPRNCIGSRFVLMEMKAFIYQLILNFSFHLINEVDYKLELKSDNPAKRTWIRLRPRH